MYARRASYCDMVWAAVAAFAAVAVDPCFAAKGGNGNGKPGGGDPPPAPVNYDFQMLPMPADYDGGIPWPTELNDHGEVVGYYNSTDAGGRQPYYYDIGSGANALTNLNDIALDPLYGLPDGAYFFAATDINNRGDIVGILGMQNDPDPVMGFVLELRPDGGGLPRLHTVPDDPWSRPYLTSINDAGTVLGRGTTTEAYVYNPPIHGAAGDPAVTVLPFEMDAWNAHLSNPAAGDSAQIFTFNGKKYTLGDFEPVETGAQRIDNINDVGEFIGTREVAGKGKKTTQEAYLFSSGDFESLPEFIYPKGLNDAGDIVGRESGGEEILLHRDLGPIELVPDVSVLFSDPSDLDRWNSVEKELYQISERGILGVDPAVADFPFLVGAVFDPDDPAFLAMDLFVLRPVPVAASNSVAAVPEPAGAVLAIFLACLSGGAASCRLIHPTAYQSQ